MNSTNEPETEAGSAGTADIEVLLVDDSEQWAEFLASDLEREASLSVQVSLNANEALLTLQENDAIECVVADYMMPEIDGIQLLQRIREDRPDLPFIFLTGQGSEDVAARAIEEGVSDYFRKDPSVDQTPLLANRIRQAVEQYRLQQELEESEQRYRTITEQISDGIVVLDGETIRFANKRVADLTGRSRGELQGKPFIETVVHPDDRETVRSVLDGTDSADEDQKLHETRLLRTGGEIRDCEYTVRSVPFENDTARLISLRDVTRRKARERNLQRERELNRTVQEALVGSRSREEIERDTVELLSEFGYALAWIGEATETALDPRAIAGDESYLEAIELSIDEEGPSGEPSVWSARTGAPQFVDDFEEMFSTGWQSAATDRGFRTGAGIPLEYDGVAHGYLAVYHTDPHAIDADERELLQEVAGTVAFAIHHTEVKEALSASGMIEVDLELSETDYYLTELAADPAVDVSNVEFTVEGTHPHGEEMAIQYVTLNGVSADTFRELAEEHASVEDTTLISADEPPRIQVTTADPPPELTLGSVGAVVGSTTVTPESALLRIELPTRKQLSTVVDALETDHGTVSVRSKVAVDRGQSARATDPLTAADLTEKQAAALRAAYHHGYYEQPRKSSAKEIAGALGVVHSTYLQHLRTAQQKLFETLYGPQSERFEGKTDGREGSGGEGR